MPEGIPVQEEIDEDGGFSPLRIAIFVIVVIVIALLVWWLVRARKPEAPKTAQNVKNIVSDIKNDVRGALPSIPPAERPPEPVPVFTEPDPAPVPEPTPTPAPTPEPLPSPSIGTSLPVSPRRTPMPPRSVSSGPEDMEVGTSVPAPV